ncbi:MAG: hypothetical protein ACK50P_03290 [Planctomycetaceae bacterium]
MSSRAIVFSIVEISLRISRSFRRGAELAWAGGGPPAGREPDLPRAAAAARSPSSIPRLTA